MKHIGGFKKALRSFVRTTFFCVLRVRVLYQAQTDAILRSGEPCLLVCNHVSLLDGVIVALASPVPLVFAVDTEYSRGRRPAARLLRMLAWLGFGTIIAIDATAPFGMRSLLSELKQGGRVMVFPEGRISETGQRGNDQPGVMWLADRTEIAVVTLEIQGAEQSRLFAKSGSAIWPRIQLIF